MCISANYEGRCAVLPIKQIALRNKITALQLNVTERVPRSGKKRDFNKKSEL